MAKEIPLTQGKVAIVDNIDYEWLMQWSWCVNSTNYAVRGERRDGHNRLILMHREIIKRAGMPLPDTSYGDHRDGNTLDNRRKNLRPATPRQSAYNLRTSNKNGYRGILHVPLCSRGDRQYRRRKPWQARIRIEGRKQTLSLGYYATAEEAARAYDEAAKEYHGEFATLNFPQEK